MNKLLYFLLALGITFSTNISLADDEMAEYTKAVEKTQKDLINATQRQQMITTPEAKEAAAQVQDVTGGNKMDQEAIYKLASQVLGEVKGNDSAALKEALANAQKDPQKFLQTLSPELQKQIRELAGRIEDRQKKP
ncbi:hypothetical protein AZI86_01325 [Bdellovibrio bacteriovorus]|uniref:Uncharacterized protein n=1 Tax=Bdellovibrio bacteriovorus TaxID=959 RepID=A0A150WNG8_BDEBC|nr:hypothetical protein [Bdellovibrio bacteriovorus]KYG65745.1 hypothetical protein AZI86_01325 [Bdellovibrio bacteriovorus]